MEKGRKNRRSSEIGSRLLNAIEQRYGCGKEGSLTQFAEILAKRIDGKGRTVLTQLSMMVNGEDPEGWNRKYFLPMEELLDIRIADIIYGERKYVQSPRGLYEIGTFGKYEDFEWLENQTDGSVNVLKSFDEWSKGIFHYVYQAENLDGLRFLVDHGYYEVWQPGHFSSISFHSSDKSEEPLAILRMIDKDDDPKHTIFKAIFDTRERTILTANLTTPLFCDEKVLRFMLEHSHVLNIVCREPEIVSETILNGGNHRATVEPYEGICASNWLTPLLCFALAHEKQYKSQAIRLLEHSYKVAEMTYSRIVDHLQELGGSEESINTERGYVELGHHYVIGVIGEPSTEGEIGDPELARLSKEVSAAVGNIRALSKIDSPVFLNGKMRLPRPNNPVYAKFKSASKGHPYLLQLSEDNEGDVHNEIFMQPKGQNPGRGMTAEEWRSVGIALRSIHDIDTGEEGKAFCHGRFVYPDIYLLDGQVEAIWGYRDVYIGNPDDDVFEMGNLAFHDSYSGPKEQPDLEAFLEGYGYPREGFEEKLADYLYAQAKKTDNANEVHYLTTRAGGILIAMRKHTGTI